MLNFLNKGGKSEGKEEPTLADLTKDIKKLKKENKGESPHYLLIIGYFVGKYGVSIKTANRWHASLLLKRVKKSMKRLRDIEAQGDK